jgi:hypothetical protein
MSASGLHREVVSKLLDSKAVDFAAIGKVLGEVGPSLALAEYIDGDPFCGTNRHFVHLYTVFNPGTVVDPLDELNANAGELQG